jgi:phage tail sheath protein FI
MYIMDIPHYDEDGTRLYIEDSTLPSVVETINKFDQRALDSSFTACYFPDVIINDNLLNNRKTEVPASIAAVTAFSFTESRHGVPWYAPAGFTRGALDRGTDATVANTTARLTVLDRDELYESKINPIANFPVSNQGFVEYKIWGQKTLQARKSALDRINVRRMVLDVKRSVLTIARSLLFKRNNPATRQDFIRRLSFKLNNVQAQQGIESFQIIMDETNNTLRDEQNYQLNGIVKIVPTRTIEFVVIDFIIDPDGVTFQ